MRSRYVRLGLVAAGMIDGLALKGLQRLEKGYEIIVDDFDAAVKRQGIADASKGDVM